MSDFESEARKAYMNADIIRGLQCYTFAAAAEEKALRSSTDLSTIGILAVATATFYKRAGMPTNAIRIIKTYKKMPGLPELAKTDLDYLFESILVG
jgi:hypothetical protein